MLEFEISVQPHLVGDLAARIMSLWMEQEVETGEDHVRFRLPIAEGLDRELERFEVALQTFETVRGVDDLTVIERNVIGPDSGPDVVRVGRFVIRRPEVAVEGRPGDLVLSIGCSAVFGTGAHASTALSLTALEEFFHCPPGAPSRQGARVLDVGTGTGILAVAAARLGAGPVLAVDVSPEAVETARGNIDANCPPGAVACECAPLEKVSGEFDLVLANLVPSVLIRSAKRIAPMLAPEGIVILSGFTDAQTPHVLKAATKIGWTTLKTYTRDGWAALALSRDVWRGPDY